MRLLIVGAGSTGGYFGGRLLEAGRDVTFLVRPRRAALIQENGLRIVSPHGNATLAPRLVTADAVAGPFDAVLVTVKAYSLDSAMDDMAPAIGPDTVVVPVLNGLRHMDALAARFGAPAVAGGVCKVAATIDGEGRVVQLAKFQELAYGEVDGTASPRMERLHAALHGAGFEARLSRAIMAEMWEKWVLLATLGGTTCLMGGHSGEIGAVPGGTAFILGLLAEVVAVATAAGYPPGERFVDGIRKSLTAPGSTQASSMFRDMGQNNPVEADQILGDLIARAEALAVPTPLLGAAYARLCIYARRVAASG